MHGEKSKAVLPFDPEADVFRWGPLPGQFFYLSVFTEVQFHHFSEKYGENWGLTPQEQRQKESFKAPSWQEIASIYSADPSRLKRLLNTDAAFARGEDEQ